jgi:catechol 2,3-dioxygenase-like lactoylglutathione lyase family enzyme
MSLRIECLTIDGDDIERLEQFWGEALGYRRTFADDYEIALSPPAGEPGFDLLLLRVPDAKQVKNRLHLDLRPDDQEAEVARLQALGATRVDIGQAGDESWVVLADPEGNEFCVLRVLDPGERKYEGDVGYGAP